MKKTLAFIGFLAVLSFTMGFGSCSSTDSATQTDVAAQQSAPPAYFTGDGGEGTSIAILAPKATGLTKNLDYLPALVQGELVSNFSEYSAIKVMDRENLDSLYKELYSGYYDDDSAELDWGHLPPTDYILEGKIIKTATGYSMQIRITKTSDKMTVAHSGTCTVMELDNFTATRRASLDLLQKIGVQVTERAKKELAGAAKLQAVAAQTADARGYTADRSGETARAAIYYTQAAAIDPSMLQTASRASTLTAQIVSGSIGAQTREIIQQGKDWKALLAETEETIYELMSSASPPYALYYSNDIEWGDIVMRTESRDARFETNLQASAYWFDSAQKAVQRVYGAVYDGLDKTGHKNTWELGNWPATGVTRQNPFNTTWHHDINVVFELVSAQGKAVGRQTYARRAEYRLRRDGNQVSIAYTAEDFVPLTFNTVKSVDINDGLSIRVASVGGKPPEQTPFQITMVPDWKGNLFLAGGGGVVTGFRPDSGVHPDASIRRSLVIPATLWGEPVTAIGDNAFDGKGLLSVVIPDSVTSIGDNAFGTDERTVIGAVTSFTLPANVQLGNNALDTMSRWYTR
ncbi:MAG: leucine-rich repeat domain-containing protein, partial [Spirochaetales bacterium]|nr:leucine-rich repeat domain-containing protein [Spirochaetales bacterium]